METINKRHRLDVGYIFRQYGQGFIDKHNLCADQLKAFKAITGCRTQAMGGHVNQCDQCGHLRIAYNSCRNRHCNKCQYTRQLVWIDKLKSTMPVCRYFHMVFTLPQQLHKLFYLNQCSCYSILFKATSQALQKVATQFLGAQVGAVAVLHTWGQSLTYHPHIHMLIPGGALSADGTEWVRAGKKFFLPVKALSKVFRGVMWSMLEKEIRLDKLRLPDHMLSLPNLKRILYEKNWNVYTKRSMAGPQSVVRYLGNYTHRVAISNSRLAAVSQGKVTFRWKDYRKALNKQLLTLNVDEFIGRFMRHILPTGFYKIRYYGILATANKAKKQQKLNVNPRPRIWRGSTGNPPRRP